MRVSNRADARPRLPLQFLSKPTRKSWHLHQHADTIRCGFAILVSNGVVSFQERQRHFARDKQANDPNGLRHGNHAIIVFHVSPLSVPLSLFSICGPRSLGTHSSCEECASIAWTTPTLPSPTALLLPLLDFGLHGLMRPQWRRLLRTRIDGLRQA